MISKGRHQDGDVAAALDRARRAAAGWLGRAHGAGHGDLDDEALGVRARSLVALGVAAFGVGDGSRVVLDDGGALQGAPASAFGLADGDDGAGAAARRLRTFLLLALLMTQAMRVSGS